MLRAILPLQGFLRRFNFQIQVLLNPPNASCVTQDESLILSSQGRIPDREAEAVDVHLESLRAK